MRTDLENHIIQELEAIGFKFGKPSGFSNVSGGCINHAGRIDFGEKQFFIKWNSRDLFPSMFEKEAEGLRILRASCPLTIPEPLLVGSLNDMSYIVMENISPGRRSQSFWKELGTGLAELHRNKSENFGYSENNFIGSLEQVNSPQDSWSDFFFEKRILHPIRLAIEKGIMNGSDLEIAESLASRISDLLGPAGSASLIHGDLWGGNIMSDGTGGPCIFDPAVYYANREIEIAFTTLFGGFEKEFYDSYNEAYPLETGFENRFELYNLYPLLVHANLFGGGYINSCRHLLKKYRK